MAARIENNGKISVSLKPDEVLILQLAIRSALYLDGDEMEPSTYCLLCETLEEMTGITTELSLRKSAFFAVFSSLVMKYVDLPTQIVIKSRIGLSDLEKFKAEAKEGYIILKR